MRNINRRTFIRNSALAGLAIGQGFLTSCNKAPKIQPTIAQTIARKPYNIVLIAIDTLRADHLGCYGYPRNTSPNIDRFFSENSFKFTGAISPSGWTVPSFASLFTGQHPLVHGIIDASKRLPDSSVTLQEILKDANYQSAFFMQDIYLASDTMLGFAQGADEFFSSRERYDAGLYDDVSKWLTGLGEKPFFLFIHSFDNHMPWKPPKPFHREFMFDDYYESREIPIVRGNHDEIVSIKDLGVVRQTYNQMGHVNDEAYYRALYDGSLKYTDYQIGQIIKKLSATGVLENTVFIVTSDHGENLGEHNHLGHHLFFEPIEKIPLLIKIPGIQSVEIAPPILLEDLPATLIDLVGLPKQYEMNGMSYLPVMSGEKKSIRDFAYATGNFWGMIRGEFEGDLWKLVLPDEGCSDNKRLDSAYLFNLSTDPKEKKNLYYERKAIVSILSRQFYEWKNALVIGNEADEGGVSEEMMKSLKALGYMGNGS